MNMDANSNRAIHITRAVGAPNLNSIEGLTVICGLSK